MPAPANPLQRSPLYFRDALLILLIASVSFLISYNSPIRAYSRLDAKGALLTAQALIQDRSLRLDGYKIRDMEWQFIRRNGHLYYAYPIGTPLLAAPFVLISLITGADMQDEEQEYITQKTIASCTVMAAGVLIFLIARCYCRRPMSILLAALWTLGTGIISTMGLALWSINFSVHIGSYSVSYISPLLFRSLAKYPPVAPRYEPICGISMPPDRVSAIRGSCSVSTVRESFKSL